MIIFWVEFPNKLQLDKLKLIPTSIKFSIYLAIKNPNQYLKWKNKFKAFTNIVINAWPIAQKDYWFSKFSTQEELASLKRFSVLKKYKCKSLKLDIEPPIFPLKKFSTLKVAAWLIKYATIPSKDDTSFKKAIQELTKSFDIILSTFPLPKFILKRYGVPYFTPTNHKLSYNFMFYSSMIPSMLLPLYKIYYKLFAASKSKETTFFALGLFSHGIFKCEPQYKSLDKFEADIKFFKKLRIKNIVIYSLEGILEKPKTEINKIFSLLQEFQ